MQRRKAAMILCAGSLAAVAALVVGDELPTKAPQKLPAAIVDTHELMEIFNEPLYEHLSEAMAARPTDKKGWSEIKHQGIAAAEIANLIAIRQNDGIPTWDALARDAQQSGIDLAQAATAQDWDKTRMAYTGLIKNCNDCHTASGDDHAPQLEP